MVTGEGIGHKGQVWLSFEEYVDIMSACVGSEIVLVSYVKVEERR